MPTLKEYTVKIARLRSTRKMTRTMKMVSANKLRKSQELLKHASACADEVQGMLSRLPAEAVCAEEWGNRVANPMALVLVVTSDRGLCGGFNNNLNRKLNQWAQERAGGFDRLRMSFCGRRGYLFFRSRVSVEKFYSVTSAKPQFMEARQIFGELEGAMAANRYDEVYLAYNEFRSSLSQTPTIERLLPWDPKSVASESQCGTCLCNPPACALARDLVQRLGTFRVFRALVSSAAGEHGARMTAMDNSTNNADDLIETYSLLRNRARQAAITRELTEIISGADAL
jgi:F-type H+-transporting ATPase subunit gamma